MFAAVLFVSLAIAGCHLWVRRVAEPYCHAEADKTPVMEVALVLGCAPTTQGRPNLFFTKRIEAAARLYQAGKARAFIVSGDNGTRKYDETTAMKEALIQAGVPEDRIHPDYAGFRTLDSVVRAREVFGQESFIVVSQRFHNERAVFLARRHGIRAEAFNADDVTRGRALLTHAREYLARVKAVLDVTVLGTQPKFLGKPVPIDPRTGTKAASGDGEFLENGVTAHRGSSLEHPENTLAAFRHAAELGADWIELDILATRDGHLVVNHDTTTGRTAERDLKIAEHPLAELRSLDVAHHFRLQNGLSLEDCPRHTMPLLAEVLDWIKTQPRSRVSIQPKDQSVAAAVRLIREKQAERWCGFNDGDLEKMSTVKRLLPVLPVFWDRPAKLDVATDIRTARERGFEALVIHHQGVTPEVIAQVQAAGLKCGAWTVNDPEAMRRLAAWDIDRIYTDDPRQLLPLMAAE